MTCHRLSHSQQKKKSSHQPSRALCAHLCRDMTVVVVVVVVCRWGRGGVGTELGYGVAGAASTDSQTPQSAFPATGPAQYGSALVCFSTGSWSQHTHKTNRRSLDVVVPSLSRNHWFYFGFLQDILVERRMVLFHAVELAEKTQTLKPSQSRLLLDMNNFNPRNAQATGINTASSLKSL